VNQLVHVRVHPPNMASLAEGGDLEIAQDEEKRPSGDDKGELAQGVWARSHAGVPSIVSRIYAAQMWLQ
jgi:hypothetical protein